MNRQEKNGKKKPEEPTRRATVDRAKLEEMLAIIIRNKIAFDAVVDRLTISHMKRVADFLGVVWRVVLDYVESHGELPERSPLMSAIHQLQSDDEVLEESDFELLDAFIEFAWDDKDHGVNMPQSSKAARRAVLICRDYLIDQHVLDLTASLLQDNKIPLGLPELLADAQQTIALTENIDSVDLSQPFPDDWDKRKNVRLYRTGVNLLDNMLGGGWRGKEIVLFLAPYGTCKTTLACHMAAGLIERADTLTAKNKTRKGKNGKPLRPVVIFVFTESDTDEYRVRIMSNLAQVPWDRLSEMNSIDDLSNDSKPGLNPDTRYELAEFKDMDSATFCNERQRVRASMLQANKHLVMLDCTDSPDSPYKVGIGGIPEIGNIIGNYLRRNPDVYPTAVILDHVSALADRVSEGKNEDEKLHLILKRMPRQAADKIGKPWNVPIMLFHQLSGDANSWSPRRRLHHAHAAGSKSIGEYVNFAIVAYAPNAESLCRMELTKHRRRPPTPEFCAAIRGRFNRIDDVSGEYIFDKTLGQVVSKAEQRAHEQTKKAGKQMQNVAYPGGGDI